MTEDHPHIVYAPGRLYAVMFPNYREAHLHWQGVHSFKTPYLIATVGRVIDPSTPIVDVNE